jgi:hypothetical protein
VNPEAALLLLVEIHSRTFSFIVDTGASLTVLQDYIAKQLHLDITPYSSPVHSASGHHVSIQGQTFLPLYCYGHYLPFHAIVIDAPGAAFAGLLGLDFITKYKGDVLVTENVLRLPDVRLPLHKKNNLPNTVNVVTASQISEHPYDSQEIGAVNTSIEMQQAQQSGTALDSFNLRQARQCGTAEALRQAQLSGTVEDSFSLQPARQCGIAEALRQAQLSGTVEDSFSLRQARQCGTVEALRQAQLSGTVEDSFSLREARQCGTAKSLQQARQCGSAATSLEGAPCFVTDSQAEIWDDRVSGHNPNQSSCVDIVVNPVDFCDRTDYSTNKQRDASPVSNFDIPGPSDTCTYVNSNITLLMNDKKTIKQSSLCLFEVSVENCSPGSEVILGGHDALTGLFLVDSVAIVNDNNKVPVLIGNMSPHPVTPSSLNEFHIENLYNCVDNIYTLDSDSEFSP